VVVGQVLGDGICTEAAGGGGQQVVADQSGIEGYAGDAFVVVANGGSQAAATGAMRTGGR